MIGLCGLGVGKQRPHRQRHRGAGRNGTKQHWKIPLCRAHPHGLDLAAAEQAQGDRRHRANTPRIAHRNTWLEVAENFLAFWPVSGLMSEGQPLDSRLPMQKHSGVSTVVYSITVAGAASDLEPEALTDFPFNPPCVQDRKSVV